MSKKDIVIIAHFTGEFDENDNNRFNYIARVLNNLNIDFELITSNYSHSKKKKRSYINEIPNVTFLEEPNYYTNVSLKRFYSHYIFGNKLDKYLKKRKKPDVIYCSIPSLNAAKVAARYAKKNNIKFIVDVQDIWPEAFKMILKFPILDYFIFLPMTLIANNVYKSADDIIAVSNTYKDRAIKNNLKLKSSKTVYLGTTKNIFDDKIMYNEICKNIDEFWITYIGTLGHSYDIITVIDALEILQNRGISNICFKIIGDGPLKEKFEKYAIQKKINVHFTGRLKYEDMVSLLIKSDVGVNPITAGSAASVINKVSDYAAASLPVLNTQDSKEYRELLDEYKAGLNCLNGNPRDLANKLMKLYLDEDLRRKMGGNSRKLFNEMFDREKTYKYIIDILKE